MKKLLTCILLISVLLFLPLQSYANRTYVSSGQQTESVAIKASPGVIGQIAIITDGTYAVTVNIYDNASAASGTKLIPTWVVATSSTNLEASWDAPGDGVRFTKGCYVEITCSGTVKYIVYYN